MQWLSIPQAHVSHLSPMHLQTLWPEIKFMIGQATHLLSVTNKRMSNSDSLCKTPSPLSSPILVLSCYKIYNKPKCLYLELCCTSRCCACYCIIIRSFTFIYPATTCYWGTTNNKCSICPNRSYTTITIFTVTKTTSSTTISSRVIMMSDHHFFLWTISHFVNDERRNR